MNNRHHSYLRLAFEHLFHTLADLWEWFLVVRIGILLALPQNDGCHISILTSDKPLDMGAKAEALAVFQTNLPAFIPANDL